MAKQLYIQLQTPTIELKVEAMDSSKEKGSLLVGFKRYTIEETSEQLENFQNCLGNQLDLLKKKEDEGKDFQEEEELSISNEKVISFLSGNVVYIKKAKLEFIDDITKKISKFVVEDSRTAKPVEDFWETPEECLSSLMDMYFNCTPWKSSFISAIQLALLNADYSEDSAKNS